MTDPTALPLPPNYALQGAVDFKPRPPDLRDLARKIRAVAEAHLCYSQACDAIAVLESHLCAMAAVDELNRKLSEHEANDRNPCPD